jgi:RES domain-containing protein
MIVYRIASCTYINDLSGKGAALYGGRWNSKDVHVLYTAQSRSLALLEAVVHLGKLPPAGFCMATIEIPDNIAPRLSTGALPLNWFGSPAPDALRAIGDRFIRDAKFLALPVPSVIMNEECNILINPAHPDFHRVRVVEWKSVRLDDRLVRAMA